MEHVKEGRKVEGVPSYFAALSVEQRAGIEAIAMDMWPPYLRAKRDWIPEAEDKMVYDRFHVMQHVGTAVDIVRKAEHKALLQGEPAREARGSVRSPHWAMRFWKRWHNWATRSQLKPMIKAAATVKWGLDLHPTHGEA